MNKIPIIDLFAGPGGLGEGFMSLEDDQNKSIFDIKLSIEKDQEAHKTLTLRSFFRQFTKNNKPVPSTYYEAIQEQNISNRESKVEKLLNNSNEGAIAKKEANLIELGSKEWPAHVVDDLIEKQLRGEKNWVLIGGPPCQAYSNAGRSRVGGIDREDHRVYLYQEYLRIIKKHKPAVFVMENVKGLLSAKVDGEKVFDWMKRDLQVGNQYSIHSLVKPVEEDIDYLIRSENYGVPQKRHRVILLGIRSDFEHKGEYLSEKDKVNLESIIDGLPKLRSGLHRRFRSYHETEKYSNGRPKREYEKVPDSNEAWLKEMTQNIEQIKAWGELKLGHLKNGPTEKELEIGGEFIPGKYSISKKHPLHHWYSDEKMDGVLNHESRAHLTQDLMRYLFSALYVQNFNNFPRINDYAKHSKNLLPDHASALSGKFTDRFRVQVPGHPATTVTSHISKDGHYFIHYDPSQCRSLTVREAARIQTFPDNYLFRGSRTAQYHQVGNAVPPYLAHQIAKIVFNVIKK